MNVAGHFKLIKRDWLHLQNFLPNLDVLRLIVKKGKHVSTRFPYFPYVVILNPNDYENKLSVQNMNTFWESSYVGM